MKHSEKLVARILEAENNRETISVDYHARDGFVIRNEFIPMDTMVFDNTVEIFDSDKGNDWKCIINLSHVISYDEHFDEYRIDTKTGELIIAL